MARVTFVEAWYRGSHRAWAEAVHTHSRHDVTLCTLPGVHWEWRLHGGPLAVARRLDETERPDAIALTSAIDASAVLGLARQSLVDVPVAVYMHDNQLTYPLAPGEVRRDLTAAMANWRSMVAADMVLWNSAFHRDDFLAATVTMLQEFPDHRHLGLVDRVAAQSVVVPPGIGSDVGAAAQHRQPADGPPLILWNHRWEWDRDPDRFVRALTSLAQHGVEFRVAITGPNLPRSVADEVAPLGDRVIHVGSCARAEYLDWLVRSDIVVSTTRHEFYGISVAEAMTAVPFPSSPTASPIPSWYPRPPTATACTGRMTSLSPCSPHCARMNRTSTPSAN
jgi:glycosyltransferase involved in cell wall biosynthesis